MYTSDAHSTAIGLPSLPRIKAVAAGAQLTKATGYFLMWRDLARATGT
jgi:hypothetical protein